MPELVSKLKTSVVVVERATGELLRTIPRKEMKLLTIHLLRKPQSMEKAEKIIAEKKKAEEDGHKRNNPTPAEARDQGDIEKGSDEEDGHKRNNPTPAEARD